jgi:glutathione-regulated potassium-efflux system protein KefB
LAIEAHGFDLVPAVALLGAGAIAVPIFKRIGLGSVIGYLVAGIVIGPFGLGLFQEPEAILSVAELGVVMLLFIIGLEMKPSRLWSLRRDIFGLGVAQIGCCAILLTGVGYLAGHPLSVASIAAMGFTMTSTAIVLQLLDERGETHAPQGQKIVSVLLLEDLAIVPLLAAVALLAPEPVAVTGQPRWFEVGIALTAIVFLVTFSRFLLNPIFRILAAAEAREILTAAALLVVLGSALVMDLGGLSMAMGAFIAGVLLSESTFRHQLEADIEPFRGLLLGLFFLGVGMSLDLSLVVRDWAVIVAIVGALVLVKSAGIYAVARLLGSSHSEAVHRALLMAQAGEFAFVLYTAAGGAGIFEADLLARLNAAVIVSMAVTPLLATLADRLARGKDVSFEGIEFANGLSGTALLIGFGRFGQVVSQPLLARGIDVSIIDNDTEMIRAAARFGFKIYYGDGTRLDVLRAAGAETAKIIAVCVDKRETADRIVEIVKGEFPLSRLLVRSYDRGHTLDLINAGVDYQIRETFESAIAFGAAALRELGVGDEDITDLIAGVRERDTERLKLQQAEGIYAGRGTLKTQPTPTPLTRPKRESRPLSEETAVVASEKDGAAKVASSDR